MDQFSEVTHEGWFSRIASSIKGIAVGGVLFVISFPVLFFNEGRAISTQRATEEAGGKVVTVAADRIDPANEGKLIHLNGQADTNAVLADPEMGISVEKAIRLDRRPEMFQWKEESRSETKKNLGGSTDTTTIYTYSTTWSDRLIKSDGFRQPEGHQNPAAMPVTAMTQHADKVMIGAFTLSPELVGRIGEAESLAVTAADLPRVKTPRPDLGVYAGQFYIGRSPAAPVVGDTRIGYQVIRPHAISLIAVQQGSTFVPYVSKSGRTIIELRDGTLSAAEMIQKALDENKMFTWILRGVGFVLMAIGICLFLRPLSVLADVIPFLGSMVGGLSTFIAVLAAGGLSLITIAIGWVVFRPLIGIPLLLLGIGGIVGVVMMRRKAAG